MRILELSIRRSAGPLRKPTAWFLPGCDAVRWIDEMLSWNVPINSTTIFAIPSAGENRDVIGVLVVPRQMGNQQIRAATVSGITSERDDQDFSLTRRVTVDSCTSAAGMDDSVSPRAIPYGAVAERFYLPVNAEIHPPVTAAELSSLLASDIIAYVFHPTSGLIGFSSDQACRVSDLLDVAPAQSTNWNCALPGVALNQRLASIELGNPPSLADIISESWGDIGTQSNSLDELPPVPNEPPSNPIRGVGHGAMSGFAKSVLWFTNLAPSTASQRTWVNDVRDWANAKLSAANQAIDSVRNKEIRRLLHMLQHDPDEGLRYAIPFGGGVGQHRGQATPSNQLLPRSSDFNLSRMRGGGRADFWDIDWQYQEQLRKKYHILANREIRLGRHRRAAYIFAELLGDLYSAAKTLADGRHFHEAAILFRDHLKRPNDAAQCLERGGLFNEAIKIYLELEQFERAADLHAKLERNKDALELYRKAVEVHIVCGDQLAAARILHAKMGETEEAMSKLESAWPGSSQAKDCMEQLFVLLGKDGKHERARRLIAMLVKTADSAKSVDMLPSILSKATTTYPDEDVRNVAADSCRVVVGSHLNSASRNQRLRMLDALEQLAKEDRLLRRDCLRFAGFPEPTLAKPIPPRRRPKPTPRLVGSFTLPGNVEWTTIKPAGETFFAAGYRNSELIIVRGNWDGAIQQPTGRPWRIASPQSKRSLSIAPASDGAGSVWISCPFAMDMRPRRLVKTDRLRSHVLLKPAPGGHESGAVLDRAHAGGFGHVAFYGPGGVVLETYAHDEFLVASREIEFSPVTDVHFLSFGIQLHARSEAIYVASHNELVWLTATNGPTVREKFLRPITSIAGTPALTRVRLAISFTVGGSVVWPQAATMDLQQAFATELESPKCCFTKSGKLIAAGSDACEIYSTNGGKVKLKASITESLLDPIAVLPTASPNEFAMFCRTGEVNVYRTA